MCSIPSTTISLARLNRLKLRLLTEFWIRTTRWLTTLTCRASLGSCSCECLSCKESARSSHPHIFSSSHSSPCAYPHILTSSFLSCLFSSFSLCFFSSKSLSVSSSSFSCLTLLQRSSGGKGDALPLPAASRGGGRRAWLQLPHGAAEGRPLGARHLLQDPQQQLFLRPLIEMNNATPSLRRFLTRLTSWELLLSFLNRSALSGFLTILPAPQKRRLSNQIQYFLTKHPPPHHLVEFFNFKANHFWQILRIHIFPPNNHPPFWSFPN